MREGGANGEIPRRTGPLGTGVAWQGLSVVCLVVLLTAPWISQGLDFTDDGLHLVQQQALLENGWLPSEPFGALIWFSVAVGAGWMRLTEPLGLLGVRIGWVVIMSTTALLAWSVLRRYVSAGAAAAATALACATILAHGTRMIIDYNKVPYLFTLAGLAFLLPPRATASRHGNLAPLGAGIAFALAGLARAPTLIVVLLPFLPEFHRRLFHGSWDAVRLQRAWRSLAVSMATIALATSLLAASGDLGSVAALYAPAWKTPAHDPAKLLGIYGRDLLLVIASGLVGWALFTVLLRAAAGVRGTQALLCGAIVALGSGVVLLAVRSAGAPATSRWFVVAVVGGSVATLLTATVTLVRGPLALPGRRHDELEALTELLLLGLGAAFAACVGTDNGVTKLVHGFWIVVPACCFIAILLLRERMPRGAKPVILALGVALALGGLVIRWSYPYRDHPDRRLLTASIDHPRLRGIRTTAGRAASVSELLRQLSGRVLPGDPLLAGGLIPLVHYLTLTEPASGVVLPDQLPVDELLQRLDNRIHQGMAPPVVVRARVDTKWPSWAASPAPPPRGATFAPLFDRWLAGKGYLVTWSNADFEMLLPPAVGGGQRSVGDRTGTLR